MTRAARPSPPATERRPFRYRLAGLTIEDPYHWLEGGAAAEDGGADPALDVAVAAWTDAQNRYARTVLDALPGRDGLEAELRALLSLESFGIPRLAGEWLFYTRRRGGEPQPVLYAQAGEDGETRVLLDVNALDPQGLLALAWYRPSPDGSLVAFGTYRSGDENTVCRVLETATGRWLDDEIAGRVDPVTWLADGRELVVRRLADPGNPYSGEIALHALGRAATDDPVLCAQHTDGALATTWGPFPIADERGRWLVVGYYTGTDANDLWYYDLAAWRATGRLERLDLLVGERALTSGFVDGDTLYALTTHGAAHKRVIAFDLASAAPARFRELIPARDDAVIASIAPARERVVVEYLVAAQSRIEVFGRDGRPHGPLDLPAIGSASIVTHRDRDVAWLAFETFGEPPAIHRVSLPERRLARWRQPRLPGEQVELAVRQVWFQSRDGTRVPMFLVHRAGLVRTGEQPTILYGYGGFDVALTPTFTSLWRPWLARGGVYAVANLRGGGELGAEWHRAGMLERKQTVFDDFYAAAEWLIEQGITSPARLGIVGRSNGGLLTGVAVTQRPALFRAAIVGVPLLDMLRYERFLMARYWVPEYGSAADPAQFEFLAAYSPYHNVRQGVRYPAVLLTAGENDTRVHPLHARKMAARLQAATAVDPAERPILLSVDRETGHGQGKPLEQRVREAADEVAFMAAQLGLDLGVPLKQTGSRPGARL